MLRPNEHGEIPTDLLARPGEEEGDYPCFACGRSTQGDRYVHLANDGFLVPVWTKLLPARDQGWFPIGAGCARKVPAAFVFDGDPFAEFPVA
jgi:hypothetical protein